MFILYQNVYVRHFAKHVCSSLSNLPDSPRRWYCYKPHFTDQKLEREREGEQFPQDLETGA